MAISTKGGLQSFFRIVKAQRGHQFANLYAVEKVTFKGGEFAYKEIVHEWDSRIISEAILARYGGQDAYENFKFEAEPEDLALDPQTQDGEARKAEQLALTKRKLAAELKLKTKED